MRRQSFLALAVILLWPGASTAAPFDTSDRAAVAVWAMVAQDQNCTDIGLDVTAFPQQPKDAQQQQIVAAIAAFRSTSGEAHEKLCAAVRDAVSANDMHYTPEATPEAQIGMAFVMGALCNNMKLAESAAAKWEDVKRTDDVAHRSILRHAANLGPLMAGLQTSDPASFSSKCADAARTW